MNKNYSSWDITLHLEQRVLTEMRVGSAEKIEGAVKEILSRIGYNITSVAVSFEAGTLTISGTGKFPLRDRIDTLFTRI